MTLCHCCTDNRVNTFGTCLDFRNIQRWIWTKRRFVWRHRSWLEIDQGCKPTFMLFKGPKNIFRCQSWPEITKHNKQIAPSVSEQRSTRKDNEVRVHLRAGGWLSGRKSGHQGPRHRLVDTFGVDQVAHSPFEAAMQMVGTAISLRNGGARVNAWRMIFTSRQWHGPLRRWTHVWQRAASVSPRCVLAARVSVLTHAPVRTDQRRAQAHQCHKNQQHLQCLWWRGGTAEPLKDTQSGLHKNFVTASKGAITVQRHHEQKRKVWAAKPAIQQMNWLKMNLIGMEDHVLRQRRGKNHLLLSFFFNNPPNKNDNFCNLSKIFTRLL